MDRVLRAMLKGGTFGNVSPARSRAMAKVRGKGNVSTERRLRFALVRAGIRDWVLHPTDVTGCPDFYFAKERLAIFVDGCFWHGCPKCGHIPKANTTFWAAKIRRNKERDRSTSARLRARGCRVLRFREHELKRRLNRCVAKICKVIKHDE